MSSKYSSMNPQSTVEVVIDGIKENVKLSELAKLHFVLGKCTGSNVNEGRIWEVLERNMFNCDNYTFQDSFPMTIKYHAVRDYVLKTNFKEFYDCEYDKTKKLEEIKARINDLNNKLSGIEEERKGVVSELLDYKLERNKIISEMVG